MNTAASPADLSAVQDPILDTLDSPHAITSPLHPPSPLKVTPVESTVPATNARPFPWMGWMRRSVHSLLSRFSWRPTSPYMSLRAQHSLIAAFPSTPSRDMHRTGDATLKATSDTSAQPQPEPTYASMHGLVDIGDGHFINTLVLDSDGFEKRNNEHDDDGPAGISERLHPCQTEDETPRHILHDQEFANSIPKLAVPVPDSAGAVKKKKALVVAHGYAAGLGFFFKNFSALSAIPGYRVYAFDWLGMANSSRLAFPTFPASMSEEEQTYAAENYFVDSLEKWRKVNGIEEMTLMGHSLGGYLSAVYALKHPERVEKLLLVSPAGIPRMTAADWEVLIERRNSSLLIRLIASLWNYNVTPMYVTRAAGPFGPYLVNGYTSRRFPYLTPLELKSFTDYIYHTSAQPGSGEYALSKLLVPGAFAKQPLIDRLHALKMPTTFIYGESDWMDYQGGVAALRTLHVPSRVALISSAGHHLYLDNPEAFNAFVRHEVLDGPRGGEWTSETGGAEKEASLKKESARPKSIPGIYYVATKP